MDAVYHGVWNNFLHDYGKSEYAEHFLVNFGVWFADFFIGLEIWGGRGGCIVLKIFGRLKVCFLKSLFPFKL